MRKAQQKCMVTHMVTHTVTHMIQYFQTLNASLKFSLIKYANFSALMLPLCCSHKTTPLLYAIATMKCATLPPFMASFHCTFGIPPLITRIIFVGKSCPIPFSKLFHSTLSSLFGKTLSNGQVFNHNLPHANIGGWSCVKLMPFHKSIINAGTYPTASSL